MKNHRPASGAFTLRETLVATFLCAMLFTAGYAAFSSLISRTNCWGILSDMRQLHMSAQQMALDQETTGGSVSWTCENGVPMTRERFINFLVEHNYQSPENIRRILDEVRTEPSGEEITFRDVFYIYAMDENDKGQTLFLATKNWHGISDPKLYGAPFENKGFAVFRKAGDGAMLSKKQTADLEAIGTGGRFNFQPLK